MPDDVTMEATIVITAQGFTQVFDLDPKSLRVKQNQDLETIRDTTGRVVEIRKVGLPQLEITGGVLRVVTEAEPMLSSGGDEQS